MIICDELNDYELVSMAQEQNEDAIDLLIEQIGNNLRNFDAELDKLKLLAYSLQPSLPEKLRP